MNKSPLIVHFYISPECDMECPFCYSMEHQATLPALQTEEVLLLVRRCAEIGARAMVFCGGDPFRRKDIVKILMSAKQHGMTTRVDSNLLRTTGDIIKSISHCLDWLALPLDGPTPNIHDSHRNSPGHFDIVTHMIRDIKSFHSNIAIKIQTLITKRNYASLINMPPIIRDLCPDVWSIYTYFRAGIGRNNYRLYELPENELKRVQLFLPGEMPCKVDVVSSEYHKGSYLFVSADGRIYRQPRLPGEEYVVFGDFRTDALNRALAELDLEGNIKRARVLC